MRFGSGEDAYSLVLGDANGDRSTDFAIRVNGGAALQESDFIL